RERVRPIVWGPRSCTGGRRGTEGLLGGCSRPEVTQPECQAERARFEGRARIFCAPSTERTKRMRSSPPGGSRFRWERGLHSERESKRRLPCSHAHSPSSSPPGCPPRR